MVTDLLSELLAEKQEKVLGKLTPPKPLDFKEEFNVIFDNPQAEDIKRILKLKGINTRVSNPTGTVYIQNKTNAKIATMLAKYGNPEV